MEARKGIGVAYRDPDGADLFTQPICPDDKNVVRLRTATLQVVRRGVAARDDVIEVTAQAKLLQTAEVIEPRRGGFPP